MGFHSWLTADSGESIRVDARKDVYMLRPDGLPPIKEGRYDGYGNFGDVDAYTECAKWNLALVGMSESDVQRIADGTGEDFNEVMRVMGIKMHYQVMSFVGDKYISDIESNISTLLGLPVEYCADFDQIAKERFTIDSLPMFKPLKFSYFSKARYDSLPASKDCPHQGYFYPDEDWD